MDRIFKFSPILKLPFLKFYCTGNGILVPQLRIKPISPGVEAQSCNHWTTRKVLLVKNIYIHTFFFFKFLLILVENESWEWFGRLFLFMSYYQLFSEKAMAAHSSTLAWEIPWTEEPGRLQSMGSWRVRHDWVTSLSLFTFIHWRRKWQPTPVFLPGESHGQGSLVGCRLWGRTESDMTDVT